MATTIISIGYEGRTPDEMIDALRSSADCLAKTEHPKGSLLCNRRRFCGLAGSNLIKCGVICLEGTTYGHRVDD